MADKKISQLTAASTPLAGTEVLPIVQSGSTVKVSSDDLTVKNVRSNASTGILQITGPAAGSTRVMTTPNANFTAARTDAAQTFTGVQTFSNAIQGNSNVIGSSGATYAAFETNNLGTHSVGVSNGANAAFIGKTTGAGSSTVAFTFGYPSATYMPAEFAYLQTNNGGETTGDFVWYLRSGTTDSQPSEVYRLTSGGDAKINNGNLVVGTAGKGIADSAGTQQLFVNTTGIGVGAAAGTKLDVVSSGTPPSASAGTVARFTGAGGAGFGAAIAIVGGNAGSSILDFSDTDAAAPGRIEYDHANNYMAFSTASTARGRITADGEWWIAGTTDQGAYNLQVNGTGVWGAGAYVNGSDVRLKDNVQPLDSGLDVVKAMRAVTFQYKPIYSKDQSVQPGFIAQELQQAMAGKEYVDGIVQSGPEYLNVAYQNIIPILVKAIQELEAKVVALETK